MRETKWQRATKSWRHKDIFFGSDIKHEVDELSMFLKMKTKIMETKIGYINHLIIFLKTTMY